MNQRENGHSLGNRLSAGLLLVALGAVAYVTLTNRNADASEPVIPEGAALSSWQHNGQYGRYVLRLAHTGRIPTGKQLVATVLSDTNCTPDDRGLSHCHNALRLPDGTQVTVINNHRMARNGCLRPGYELVLNAIDRQWVTGTIVNR